MRIDPVMLLVGGVIAAAAVTLPALAADEPSLPLFEVASQYAGDCNEVRLSGFRGSDAVLACTCPTEVIGSPTVWGTDVYTDDSSICMAARHKGTIGADGGLVTLQILPGRQNYSGSTRNGVYSNDYGSWDSSFRFVSTGGRTPVQPPPEDIPPPILATNKGACGNAAEWRDEAYIVCTCPAFDPATAGTVWGTDTYTDDSDVCAAAVHAGRLAKHGGTVGLYMQPGQSSYEGSTRNGVVSQDYGSWEGSFGILNLVD